MKRDAGALRRRSNESSADAKSPSRQVKNGMRSHKGCRLEKGGNDRRSDGGPPPGSDIGGARRGRRVQALLRNNGPGYRNTHQAASADWTTLR